MSTMDNEQRADITAAFEQAAKLLLERDLWRGWWRVEIDGCVYKFKIEAYPKQGTPRWQQREDERKAAMAEMTTDNDHPEPQSERARDFEDLRKAFRIEPSE